MRKLRPLCFLIDIVSRWAENHPSGVPSLSFTKAMICMCRIRDSREVRHSSVKRRLRAARFKESPPPPKTQFRGPNITSNYWKRRTFCSLPPKPALECLENVWWIAKSLRSTCIDGYSYFIFGRSTWCSTELGQAKITGAPSRRGLFIEQFKEPNERQLGLGLGLDNVEDDFKHIGYMI